MQSTDSNPLLGMESRTELLRRLGRSLLSNKKFYVDESCRPGHLIGKSPVLALLEHNANLYRLHAEERINW